MTTGQSSLPDARRRIVYSASEVSVGDTVAYPGRLMRKARNERDWLLVSRIEDSAIFGHRVNPEEWEREVEFTVVPAQIEERGVEVRNADEWQTCWECGEPLTPENAPRVEGGIECQKCLTVWAIPEEDEDE